MHILQSTLIGGDPVTERMYLRLDNEDAIPLPCVDPSDDPVLAVRMRKGNTLSTDTFFGSFYRAYWQEYTGVKDISVAVDIKGEAWVHIYEDTGAGVRVVHRELLRPRWREQYLLKLPMLALNQSAFADSSKSRVFVVVEALGPTEVHRIDFVTETPPVREARLSIGLCTFNQEKYIAETLGRVVHLLEREESIARVSVVNQGNPFESDVIRDLLRHPRIELIEQRNLGGCGGFTRSLDEALVADETTHHLMMDDDIVLDARMIARARRFLDFTDTDIALGAGMLDAMRPTVMYEAGAHLSDDNKIQAYCHNVDMSDPGQLHHFNKPVDTDYNAWWFCVIPLDRARALELPAPVFIRGDDFEYGQRLARDGVPTVTLPGIAVWHEPFYAKPTGWQGYYDLRNRLIFGATYSDRVRQLSLAHVTGLITTAILTHDYMMAELRLKAVEDFLMGPEALFAQDTEALHKSVMALAKAHAPEKLEGKGWKTRDLQQGRPASTVMRELIAQQALSMLKTGLLPLKTNQRPVYMDADAHPRNTVGRSYVLTNGPRSYHLGFTPDRGRMWALMRRTVALMLLYRRTKAAVSADWADKIARYRKADWWSHVYAVAEAVQDVKGSTAETAMKAAE